MSRRFPFKREVTPLIIAVATAVTFGTVWLARALVVDPPRTPWNKYAVLTKGERDAGGDAGGDSYDPNAASLSGQGQPQGGKREVIARA